MFKKWTLSLDENLGGKSQKLVFWMTDLSHKGRNKQKAWLEEP